MFGIYHTCSDAKLFSFNKILFGQDSVQNINEMPRDDLKEQGLDDQKGCRLYTWCRIQQARNVLRSSVEFTGFAKKCISK